MKGAHGVSTISFEEGGNVACIDATIEGFDPLVAQLRGGPVSNKPLTLDFSSQRLAPGRFNGCIELSAPGTAASVVAAKNILHDPTAYYFLFKQTKSSTQAIGGQLNDVIV